MVSALESQHKGTRPQTDGWWKKGWGQATDRGQCFEFPSVPWYSSLADRKKGHLAHKNNLSEYSKSALTDHANQANHTIDWKKDYGHRQRTRPSYQVDQGSCRYLQGRSSSYESRRGQLSVESRLRPLSWCDSWSSHQDSEELSTSFFWWRSRDEIKTWK